MSGDKILQVLSEVQDRLSMTKSHALGNSSMSQIGNEEVIERFSAFHYTSYHL